MHTIEELIERFESFKDDPAFLGKTFVKKTEYHQWWEDTFDVGSDINTIERAVWLRFLASETWASRDLEIGWYLRWRKRQSVRRIRKLLGI